MNLWEERAARNEALFREVNEQMHDLAGRHGDSARDQITVVCECSDDRCVEQLELPLTAYEEIRQDGRQFVVAPGHEGDFERVVARERGYTIVKKQGTAGRIAEQADPRP
jgi:hypothetical protein